MVDAPVARAVPHGRAVRDGDRRAAAHGAPERDHARSTNAASSAACAGCSPCCASTARRSTSRSRSASTWPMRFRTRTCGRRSRCTAPRRAPSAARWSAASRTCATSCRAICSAACSRSSRARQRVADIDRVFEIWNEKLEASGGPFLFGRFSIADAMYFPVLTRFRTYGVDATAHARPVRGGARSAPRGPSACSPSRARRRESPSTTTICAAAAAIPTRLASKRRPRRSAASLQSQTARSSLAAGARHRGLELLAAQRRVVVDVGSREVRSPGCRSLPHG